MGRSNVIAIVIGIWHWRQKTNRWLMDTRSSHVPWRRFTNAQGFSAILLQNKKHPSGSQNGGGCAY
jgi:hypothetical protein